MTGTYFDADRVPYDGRPLTPPRTSRHRRSPDPGHGAECRTSNPEVGCLCGEAERQNEWNETHPRLAELEPGQRVRLYGDVKVTVLSVEEMVELDWPSRPWVRMTYQWGTFADGSPVVGRLSRPSSYRVALVLDEGA